MPSEHDQYHTHHQSRRLRRFDYTQPAAYFVTLCTHDRTCLFGEIQAGKMQMNAWGNIVEEEWRQSESMRAEVVLDAFVVMPNHLHGIVVIVPPGTDPVTATDAHGYHLDAITNRAVASTGRSTLPTEATGPPPKSLGSMVAGFKSAATRRINLLRGTPGAPVWQRGYHDRILRTERAWRACRHYIEQNPARWNEDKNHPDRF